jgi:glycosyltransferase involved in cell wall biosynthesis
MIGVIVPAHNEEAHIGDCLKSLLGAAGHADLAGEPVEIIVVLDACDDGTGTRARGLGARTIDIRARNVGMARRAGAAMARAAGARGRVLRLAELSERAMLLVQARP